MTHLTDTYNRKHDYLRISVTDRCNLRCSYCIPPQGIRLKERSEILTFDEVERLTRIFALMGVKKIRLTGGEPLVRKDLPRLIHRLSAIPGIQIIGMTTNGVLLKSFARELKQAGLTNLNVSLDSLRPSRFEMISGRQHFDDVIDGIYASLETGFQPLKLNMVVMGGINDDELLDFIEFVRGKPINVRFIEYMPFKFNQWNRAKFVSFQQMMETIDKKFELQPVESQSENSVTKDFWIDGFVGTVSFITSMSDHFCGTCNRIRLTADGSIKSCLFHQAEINLHSALRSNRSDESIEKIIRSAVLQKQFEHPVSEELVKIENRSMIQIGG
ncbi:MAG: GTP 3',8-cyclase MoaA [Ignavibacteriales bacterium]|nr:GTP 3',8-cyclase MoaA [Ignavibacteriales bacterium]